MSAPTNPPPGLRERKKIKLRRAIQTAALRLFETQGYEHTTVEQIAEAAETPPPPLSEPPPPPHPAGEPLTAPIRAAMAAVVAAAEADRDLTLARMRLVAAGPGPGAPSCGPGRG